VGGRKSKAGVIFPGFLRLKRPPFRFSIDEPYSKPSPETRSEGGKAPRCGLSPARLITGKLDAKRDAGETLDKIASLWDLVKALG
jgi:hypothetical protein